MASDQLVGGYRLLNLMMTGQTSQVWEVVEPSSHRHFALKLLLPETSRSPEHLQYLTHEAHVGQQLHHPNVIKVLRLVKEKQTSYIVMEFFPSNNLKLRIMRKSELIKEKAHSIIEQAASGLAHLHAKGWVHRDVKPDNILVNSAADVRIIDFALAKRISKSKKGGLFGWFRKKPKTQGTRSYMSPEQIRAEPLDARADIYSLGASLYEMVTARPPFRGMSATDLLNKHLREMPASPKTYNPQVTDEFAKLVMSMLEKKRENRPRDLHEFVAAFRNVRVFQGDKLEPKQPGFGS